MANLIRVVINWTGGQGLPGFTNLHFRNQTPGIINQAVVDDAVTKADAFLASIRSAITSSVTTQLDSTIPEIDETDGKIQAFWTGTVAAGAVGTGGGTYSAPSGAVVNWKTDAVRDGRLLRGRSFLVPLSTLAYEDDGSINATRLTTLRDAADALVGGTGDSRLVVFGRPNNLALDNGVSAEVTVANVPDKAAILTSRRD